MLEAGADTGSGHAGSHGEAAAAGAACISAVALAISVSAAWGVVAGFSSAVISAGACGTLLGDCEIGGDGGEVEGVADEGAERNDEFVGVDVPTFDEFLRGFSGEPDLVFGS